MVKINENANCSKCKFRGVMEEGYFLCRKGGKKKPSDVCKKYVFDPFAKQIARPRKIDTSMFDPLDFEL